MITVDDLMLEFKWDEEEEPTVQRKFDGAIALIKGADAYDEKSDILPLVISEMVGTMMENRGGYTDFKDIKMFPISLQGLINTMKYNMPESSDPDGETD